jgi:hypothetical protein
MLILTFDVVCVVGFSDSDRADGEDNYIIEIKTLFL